MGELANARAELIAAAVVARRAHARVLRSLPAGDVDAAHVLQLHRQPAGAGVLGAEREAARADRRRVVAGPALGVALPRDRVPHRKGCELLAERGAVGGQHVADGLSRVVVRPAGRGVGPIPDLPDHAGADGLAQEPEPDPRAVMEAAPGAVVERYPGVLQLAVSEVLAVVVDAVIDLTLHPGGRALHQPGVL